MMNQAIKFDVILHEGPEATLEVSIEGRHLDGTAAQIGDILSAAVEQHNRQYLIVNLSNFEYTFGNDIGGALLRGVFAHKNNGGALPCRLVARGKTAQSLKSLIDSAHVGELISTTVFERVESAIEDAKAV